MSIVTGGSRSGWSWRSIFCCCGNNHNSFDVQSSIRSSMRSIKKQQPVEEKIKTVFLHGILYIEIIAGKDLPNLDTFTLSSKDVSDPYVTVDTWVDGKSNCRIAKTSVIFNDLNPQWGEKFRVEVCQDAETMIFTVKDVDIVSVDAMATLALPAQDLMKEEPISGWFNLRDKKGNDAGSLHLALHYRSAEAVTKTHEIPDTVYPMREGCYLTLYQDAHTPALPPLTNVPAPRKQDRPYQPTQLWIDLENALNKAQKFIYIVGWSMKADITLRRGGDKDEILGELLKRKAEEGVNVLIMLWEEPLTSDNKLTNTDIMGTHDKETRAYFDNTNVRVLLTTRQKKKGKILESSFVSTCYSHHQKCIILDANSEEGDKRRKIVSFIGGIDVTDGRWDTPDHQLYKTLVNEHKDDFYQKCCLSNVSTGPRQPWHDIHSYVEGPIALDILTNFRERWIQCEKDYLHPINSHEFLLQYKLEKDDPTAWNIQFFRSINSDSVHYEKHLINRLRSKKGNLYESSIQQAYVHQIRRAKKFIYIENQYFLGSSHGWLKQEAKCPQLIPLELTTRIIKAIQKGEDFRVYIIIPLHPEGNPADMATQEILHWQRRTMEMMYHKIAKALKDINSKSSPTDYLAFYCLAKRESADHAPESLKQPDTDTVPDKARQHMRFMIYVHSKMAIFDDEYIILGSANINERSMGGNRDSEMAIGAYQPEQTREKKGDEIDGDLRSFRLALWAEHTGIHSPEHLNPSSLSCIKQMTNDAEKNLQQYISPDPKHSHSHLLTYPVLITANGELRERNECPNFPDTTAPVLGSPSNVLPNTLTT